MPRWEKNPHGEFHTWVVSGNVRVHRAVADGTITVYVQTVDRGVQSTTSFPLPDEDRRSLVEAFTTEPDDEGETR